MWTQLIVGLRTRQWIILPQPNPHKFLNIDIFSRINMTCAISAGAPISKKTSCWIIPARHLKGESSLNVLLFVRHSENQVNISSRQILRVMIPPRTVLLPNEDSDSNFGSDSNKNDEEEY